MERQRRELEESDGGRDADELQRKEAKNSLTVLRIIICSLHWRH